MTNTENKDFNTLNFIKIRFKVISTYLYNKVMQMLAYKAIWKLKNVFFITVLNI